jgi:large subunit ribosomal protein L7/L12
MEFDPFTVELGDAIANMTLAECAQLSTYLEDVHGLKKGGAGQIQMPNLIPEPKVEEAPKKTAFGVVFEGIPDATKKLGVIKAVREITGLSLLDARSFIDTTPKTIKTGVTETEAKETASRLEAAGAKVSIN